MRFRRPNPDSGRVPVVLWRRSAVKFHTASRVFSATAELLIVWALGLTTVLAYKLFLQNEQSRGDCFARWVVCGVWSSSMLSVGLHIQSDQSVLALLKLPIIWIMGLCLVSGAASITFIESILSLYLDKQVRATKS